MDLGQIISRSFRITWRNKVLWVFGSLMALTSGGANFGNNVNYQVPAPSSTRPNPAPPNPFGNFTPPDQTTIIAILAVIGCLLLLYLVLFFYFRFVARGALITGARDANNEMPTKFGDLWRAGNKNYARLLGLGFVVNVPLVLISLVLIVLALLPLLPLFATLARPGQAPSQQDISQIIASAFGVLALFCCVIGVLIVLNLVIHPIYEFAARAIVVDETGVRAGLARGWQRVRENFGNVALLYLALIALRFGFGLATLIVAIPAVLIVVGALIAAAASSNFVIIIVVALALGIPIFLIFVFLEGLWQTYEATAWTLGYVSLANVTASEPSPAPVPTASTA